MANHGKTNRIHGLCTNVKLFFEINHCEQLIEHIYLESNCALPKIKYFRPGSMYITNDIYRVLKSLGYKIVLGSVYTSDTKLPFPNLLSWYIKLKTKSNDIIILHDRPHCPSTLKKIIPYLKFDI